jgi:hypothetical protein
VLFETFAGLALYKELSETFRPQGICIQPVMSQYVASVPSQPLAEIQSMREAIEAWSSATIAVISFSQYELLKSMPSQSSPRMILLDCRFTTVKNLSSAWPFEHSDQQDLVCLLTPMQMALLEGKEELHAIAFPTHTERSSWDPHLRGLYVEISTKKLHSEESNLCLEPLFTCDMASSQYEAISEIKDLLDNLKAARRNTASFPY